MQLQEEHLIHPPMLTNANEAPPGYPDEAFPSSLQETHITAILRAMSLGHLWLGGLLALVGVIMEVVLRQPAFFGLAASGGMLGACGLITLLGISRQRASQSPLAFYLLPYADFAIVGLWLLLFSANGPIVLFYAYVVISAALLLGSRHAIALAGIAGATVLAISLGQDQDQVMPALSLPFAAQVAFTIVSTTLALGLIAYVAWLFSLNLDRFIALTNRQRRELLHTRAQMAEQQEQTQAELEQLSNIYMRFIAGDTEARVSVTTPQSALTFAAHLLNSLMEQLERHLHATSAHTRLEGCIEELRQALDRLTTGDITALHILSNPTGTALDTLTLALARLGRQLISTQQALQHVSGGYSAVLGIASDLSSLRQTLGNTDIALRDLRARAEQTAAHVHALLLASEGNPNDIRSSERPFLHEMELGAHQQSAGAELLRARLGHIGGQMQSIEAELRRIAESMEQLTRTSRPIRTDQLNAPPNLPSMAPAPSRPPSGTLRAADALPRRFTGPMMPPARPPTEQSNPWHISLGQTAHDANGPHQEHV